MKTPIMDVKMSIDDTGNTLDIQETPRLVSGARWSPDLIAILVNHADAIARQRRPADDLYVASEMQVLKGSAILNLQRPRVSISVGPIPAALIADGIAAINKQGCRVIRN